MFEVELTQRLFRAGLTILPGSRLAFGHKGAAQGLVDKGVAKHVKPTKRPKGSAGNAVEDGRPERATRNTGPGKRASKPKPK